MICPICGNETEHKDKCLNCGTDLEFYQKTENISNKLYNEALQYAKKEELSKAVNKLNLGININKNNYMARNLLGLIYFEIGQIGEALKQWIISTSINSEDKFSKGYIDILQADQRKLEKYNNSIKMYNKALEYLSQKSEDMAIIQLKKAVDLNPNFIEAANLITLCYINEKNYDKALVYNEKVLALDISNETAMKYYIEIKKFYSKPSKNEKNISKTVTKSTIQKPLPKKRNIFFNEISGFILGAVCVWIFMKVLVLNDLKENYKQEIIIAQESYEKNYDKFEQKIKENESIISQNESKIEELEDKVNQLTQKNKNLNLELEKNEKIQQVQQVSILYNNGDKEEAASILKSINEAELPSEVKSIYDSQKQKILPELATTYHYEGINKFYAGDYEGAKVDFEKSLDYSSTETFSVIGLYHLGRCAEILGDNAYAKQCYERVVNEYNDPTYLWWANSRIPLVS